MKTLERDEAAMTAARLLELRRRKGWTQQHLAQNLGVSLSAVQHWENGRRPIKTITALAIRTLLS